MHHELEIMLDGIDPLSCVDMPVSLSTLVEMTKYYIDEFKIDISVVDGTVEGLQKALDKAGVYTYISDNYFEVYGRWSEELQNAINESNN